jgi:nitrite reductase/ring-hydroxylating ferredoxin subunit
MTAAPVVAELSGRRVVTFLAADGPTVLDAECSHMGADLGRGCMVAGRLRCPFHGWEYDGTGRCIRIPGQEDVPPFARQTAFPAAERHGLLFAYLGRSPGFALPEFFGPGPTLVAGRPIRYVMDCPWQMFGANGFDLQHFALVHDRELVGEAEVDSPSTFARRIRFTTRIVGDTLRDRALRAFLGDRVGVSITVWGGTLIAVTARFRRTTSRLLFGIAPLDGEKTRVDLVVFAEPGPRWRRWSLPLSLALRRALSLRFVRDDTDRVPRASYRPGTLVESDRVLIDYYRWLAALPLRGDFV